jgi:hypothetical protein
VQAHLQPDAMCNPGVSEHRLALELAEVSLGMVSNKPVKFATAVGTEVRPSEESRATAKKLLRQWSMEEESRTIATNSRVALPIEGECESDYDGDEEERERDEKLHQQRLQQDEMDSAAGVTRNYDGEVGAWAEAFEKYRS